MQTSTYKDFKESLENFFFKKIVPGLNNSLEDYRLHWNNDLVSYPERETEETTDYETMIRILYYLSANTSEDLLLIIYSDSPNMLISNAREEEENCGISLEEEEVPYFESGYIKIYLLID